MFELFFEDKVVIFTDDPGAESPDAFVYAAAPGERIGIAKMLEKFGNTNRLTVKTADPLRTFELFASQFVPVEAGGGIVKDAAGRLLMIHRNGRWDLPKGHLEKGETPAEGAEREVREETGAEGLEIGELMAVSRHFYNKYGKWELKRTWWFAMHCEGSCLAPQTEEGIAAAEWIAPEKLAECEADCFASVRQVLRDAGLSEKE